MSKTGPLKALLWGVDGTVAETERDGHRLAFNRAFEDCGAKRWREPCTRRRTPCMPTGSAQA